jgi:hypothetical protein
MLDDLLKSAKQTISERLASPLLGSFVVAWCAWNYKFLVILFSSATVSRTFELIETISFPDSQAILTRGFFFPLITALGYIFLYPYPARLVYGFSLRRQKEINQLRKQIDDETPLTVQESRQLRAEYFELELKNQEKVDKLNSEVNRLNTALEEIKTKMPLAIKIKPTEQPYGTLELTQVALLRTINAAGGEISEPKLLRSTTESKTRVQYDIDELIASNLIVKSGYNSSSEQLYKFTHEGRRAILRTQGVTKESSTQLD